MADITVVLASASPRRAELLRRLGLDPIIRPPEIDESADPGETPAALVARLAHAKFAATPCEATELVIAADTVVVLERAVLGKPKDSEEATTMLRALSDRAHRVLTGVHLSLGDQRALAVEETEVRFCKLSEAVITAYIATGEPFDKAGAYGIQGAGGMFVSSITGSDSNVVGLPLATVSRLAAEIGIELLPR